MGTSIHIVAPDDDAFADGAGAVMQRFAHEEQRFSRFRGDSELSRVNARGGRCRVSAEFAQVLAIALHAAADSDGRFDPTVRDALVAAGYDRDLDEVLAGARGRLHPATACGRWREIELDDDVAWLPPEVHLDLGGIAKGWTVDRAAEDALVEGCSWIVVNAGGDLRVAGEAPAIEVGVEDPIQPDEHLLRLRLSAGGIATSSVAKRSWGDGLHHLIDPATGAPVSGDVQQVTAWAPTCAEAEIRATTNLLDGSDGAIEPDLIVVTDTDVIITMAETTVAA
jgi:thiamine biosynthesis lipoprotein